MDVEIAAADQYAIETMQDPAKPAVGVDGRENVGNSAYFLDCTVIPLRQKQGRLLRGVSAVRRNARQIGGDANQRSPARTLSDHFC